MSKRCRFFYLPDETDLFRWRAWTWFMVPALALLLLPLGLLGCGDAFTPRILDARPDAAADAPPVDASGPEARADAPSAPDVVGERKPDAGHDAAPPVDAHAEAAADVVAADVVAETCPTPPAAPGVCDGIPAGGGVYCLEILTGTVTYTTAPSPSGCECVATYSCACVTAQPDPCNGMGSYVSCSVVGGVPVVECSVP